MFNHQTILKLFNNIKLNFKAIKKESEFTKAIENSRLFEFIFIFYYFYKI
jgi:hypothetical protein